MKLIEPAGVTEIEAELTPLLAQIDETRRRIEELVARKPADASSVDEILESQYIYHSNAIEGNSLTSSETEDVLRGATISGKPAKDVFEAKNLRWAIQEARKLALGRGQFDEQKLLTLHEMILRGIDDEHAGRFRKTQRVIGGNPVEPPEPLLIPDYMQEFWQWQNEAQVHPALKAAIAHWWLVRIHPFHDGNGRTARLALYIMLAREGYRTGPIVLKDDQQKYYDSLMAADRGDILNYAEFALQSILRALRQYERQLASRVRSEKAMGDVLPLVEAKLARQDLLLYEIWKLAMEAVKAEFTRVAAEVTDRLHHRVEIQVRDYGMLSLEKWQALKAEKAIGDQWYFGVTLSKPMGQVRYVFWFSPTPEFSRRAVALGPTVGLNISKKIDKQWTKLSGPGKPSLRHIFVKDSEHYEHIWIDAPATHEQVARRPIHPTDPRTIATEFVQQMLEAEFA